MESQGNDDELSTLEWVDLNTLHDEMLDEQANTRRLEQRLARLMNEAAFQEFPALKNMSAEQLGKFADRISRAASNFAMEVTDFASLAENET